MRVHWKRSTVINDYSGAAGLCVSAASSIGIGVFVICGYVAKHVAGPATVVSVLITATIAILTGLFYAELSQRLPRKASPYTFSNVCIGRLAAFLTGWSLILEYVVAVAIVAKAVGLYLDTLLDEVMQKALLEAVPIPSNGFADYFDFFAFGLVIVVGLIFLFDLRRYHMVDNVALAICLGVIIFIITTGGFNANTVNWSGDSDSEPPSGFLPFGPLSIFRGAAMFSFAFIAVESLIRAKPSSKRSVSYTGLLSFAMVLLSLIGSAVVLTLMWPHHLMHPIIPIPHAFNDFGLNAAKSIVSIAAIVILSTSLWTLMFPLKRQIHAFAEDGLLPFASHNRRALGVTLLLVVTISSLLAGLFTMGQLIGLLSVGTLLMFIVIAVAIVMLRFSHQLEIGSISPTTQVNYLGGHSASRPTDDSHHDKASAWMWLRQIGGCGEIRQRPTQRSFLVVKIVLTIQMVAMVGVALLIRFASGHMYALAIWAIASCATCAVVVAVCLLIISVQPMRLNAYHFQAPLVSLTATVSVFGCILLIVMLDDLALIRFAVAMVVGVPVYVVAIRRNKAMAARQEQEQKKWQTTTTTGISKIQSIHSNGFAAAKPSVVHQPYVLPTMEQLQGSSNQMMEIGVVEENEKQLKAYVMADGLLETPLNVVELGHKSRTPSPTSSLDDICLASDVMDTLSERKEPNGKVYYVDETKSEKTVMEATQQDVENTDSSGDDVEPYKIEPQQTIAVIHIARAEQEGEREARSSVSTSSSVELSDRTYTLESVEDTSKNDLIAHNQILNIDCETVESILIEHSEQHLESNLNQNSSKDESNNIITLPTDTEITPSDQETISNAVTPSLINGENQLEASDEHPSLESPESPEKEIIDDQTVAELPILIPSIKAINSEPFVDSITDNEATSAENAPSSNGEFTQIQQSVAVNFEAHLKTVDSDSDEEPPSSIMFHAESSASEAGTTAPSTPPDPDATSQNFKDRLSMLIVQNRSLDRQLSLSRKTDSIAAEYSAYTPDTDIKQSPQVTLQTPALINGIPPPPRFDQGLYDSVNGVNVNSTSSPEIGNYSATAITANSVNDDTIKPVRDDESTSSSSEDEAPERMMVSIRQKLENILSQGRPLRASYIDGMVRPVSTAITEAIDVIEVATVSPQIEANVAIQPASPLPHPPSTPSENAPLVQNAHRVAFNDVLKSINRQISHQKPPVLRVAATKPLTIEDARLSLRHVDRELL